MAFSAGVLWRARQGGNAVNGGGFDPTVGVPGTNYSIQNAAQVAYTDIVIDATTNTSMTSAATPFTAAHVGNIVCITAGTGFTFTRYVILSVTGGVATVDKSLGTLGSTGGTGSLGGAVADIDHLENPVILAPGNIKYIETGTYTDTVVRTIVSDGANTGLIRYIGCAVDAAGADADIAESVMPVFTTATTSISIMTLNTATYLYFRNIKTTHTGATRGTGWDNISVLSNNIFWRNCVSDGCLIGWHCGTSSATRISRAWWAGCVVRNSTSTTLGGWYTTLFNNHRFDNCIAEDNAGPGWSMGTAGGDFMLDKCVADTNGGPGVKWEGTTSGGSLTVDNCAFFTNAVNGIKIENTTSICLLIMRNNIFEGHSGSAVNCATAAVNELCIQRNNAFFNNGSFRTNLSAGSDDITLTGSPFTDAAGGDFSLNSTAGAGASCRGGGNPAKIGLSDDATATSVDVGPSWPPIGAGGSAVFNPLGSFIARSGA